MNYFRLSFLILLVAICPKTYSQNINPLQIGNKPLYYSLEISESDLDSLPKNFDQSQIYKTKKRTLKKPIFEYTKCLISLFQTDSNSFHFNIVTDESLKEFKGGTLILFYCDFALDKTATTSIIDYSDYETFYNLLFKPILDYNPNKNQLNYEPADLNSYFPFETNMNYKFETMDSLGNNIPDGNLKFISKTSFNNDTLLNFQGDFRRYKDGPIFPKSKKDSTFLTTDYKINYTYSCLEKQVDNVEAIMIVYSQGSIYTKKRIVVKIKRLKHHR